HLPPQTTAAPSRPLGDATADARVAAAVEAWVEAALSRAGSAGGPLHEPLMDLVETTLIQKVVDAAGGNRTAAAKLLGLDRATLRTKLAR
ncbi:MAG: helix-turn-helix domain-containing protein, partial [Planctomycetia bacterium]